MAEPGPGTGVSDTQVCGFCSPSVASDSKQTPGWSIHEAGQHPELQTHCVGGQDEGEGGVAGAAWPHPRNKDHQGYVFPVRHPVPPSRMTNGPSGLAAFYGNTWLLPCP